MLRNRPPRAPHPFPFSFSRAQPPPTPSGRVQPQQQLRPAPLLHRGDLRSAPPSDPSPDSQCRTYWLRRSSPRLPGPAPSQLQKDATRRQRRADEFYAPFATRYVKLFHDDLPPLSDHRGGPSAYKAGPSEKPIGGAREETRRRRHAGIQHSTAARRLCCTAVSSPGLLNIASCCGQLKQILSPKGTMARCSPPLLHRFFCCAAKSASATAAAASAKKKNIIFLGSPQVAASVLDTLLAASGSPDSIFQVAAIVTQPPAAKNRGRKLMPSAVAQLALDRGFPHDLIFTPERAGEESFLTDLKEVRPELCITAAYGNILPQRFLDIPPYGTVNIHPSLLPLYRGAAPVQRALQDGVAETGVSLAYTVRALDAGPVIACERFSVDDCIKAPELLSMLFNIGSKLLLHELPSVLDGSAKQKAKPQDDSKATLAPKMNSEESWLTFDEEAKVLHNKVRAFAGWPGTRAKLQLMSQKGEPDVLDIKVISTKVSTSCDKTRDENEILFSGNSLLIPCSQSTWLEILELQLAGKKVTTARDFWNGLRGQKLLKSP